MPAYSIGKQEKKASFINNNHFPGVGAYNSKQQYASKSKRGPTFIIGKTARLKTQNYLGPSPNTYDLIRYSFFAGKSKGAHLIGKSKQRVRSEGPGPANYSAQKFYSSKKYSFGIKNQFKNLSKDFPGPGMYDPEKVKHSNGISFQQSKRPSLESSPQSNKPGPGEYNNNIKETKNKFSFPKRQKFFQDSKQLGQKKQYPGPGFYSNLCLSSVKKQIAAIKFNRTKRDYLTGDPKIPGPGAYSPSNQLRKKSPIAIIGNERRNSFNKDKNLGPGSYNLVEVDNIKKKQPSVIFGKSRREEKNSNNNLKIGPGDYNIDYHDRGRAYSISGRNQHEKDNNSPGPVSYSPKYESQFRKTEMTIIGKDSKFHLKTQENPGPGTYNSVDFTKMSKTFYFPKQIRKNNVNANPGPGSYQIKPMIGSQSSKD